ncbi:hypothetical protein FE257_004314 [Aspergillus nanangensis]|uniref:Uncharacterized protein n=1 Tax=Aspergillus nanangensis TaxID=2582783 RepID=A0AAD4GN63_ASPNN|nr:hypothetical protein FE257_004314 [Aspergillus nanangensis]
MSGQGSQQEGNPPSQIELFERLRAYPFVQDSEFAKGLAIILSHPDHPASEAEINRTDDLVLKAKCFYFTRKESLASPIDVEAYKAWVEFTTEPVLSSQTESSGAESQQTHAHTTNPASLSDNSSQGRDMPLPAQEPTYPSSFAHIVELITTGQPIPGIQEIPDTVLAGHDSLSSKPRRRKPWETEEATEIPSTTSG